MKSVSDEKKACRHAAACGRLGSVSDEKKAYRHAAVCGRLRNVSDERFFERIALFDVEAPCRLRPQVATDRRRRRTQAVAMRSVSDENSKFSAKRRGRGSAPRYGRESKGPEPSPRPQPAL